MTSVSQHHDDGASENLADVAIVGYGPVGQALALKLAQAGHRVVVLERWPQLYGLPRAVGLDHEAMRILQSLGIIDEFEAHTCLSHVYEWRNGKGELLAAFPGLDETAVSGWPRQCGFSQPALERLLDERVGRIYADRVVVYRNVTVVAAIEYPDKVVLETRPTGDIDVESRRITARYVVGCDGAGSFVRDAMGASLAELGFVADWLVVDVQPSDPSQWSADVIQVCDPRGPTTMVPGGPGRRRFEFMMLEGENKSEQNNPQAAWARLERWGWTPANAILERHAVYTFRAAVADLWRRERLMIAGDAAHLTPPFAAQGLCAGLRDVIALAWRLDAVLRGAAAETLLDSYGPERQAHATVLVEFAVMLGEIICVLDPVKAEERDEQLRNDAGRGEQTWPTPRLGCSPLVRQDDPSAGWLSVQGCVQLGERTARLDDLMGSGFVLIGHGHDPSNALTAEQHRFLAAIGAKVIGIGGLCAARDVDGTYARWFEQLGTTAVLVRPDFYVFGSGEASVLISDLMAAWKRDVLAFTGEAA
ncbi:MULTISPECIES: bifunctional 3-(3-hydroxy-phenyl)propionate/3-hydroxycinnamic acid hydroxylase [Burkholderia]|uniref:bifunctional 3-(3-hydroxy-phenyl)propionate/3-hydroxycinnamic acid hydroxylase MhpA n=1 Tax=Burkholderia TaxID=32008 RepID=UPI000BF1F90A|nr:MULTISPECIES: bifunctional 3-(3-hydroxy-phenyl)propionate/3-hydroxycinnamic acid hydroxylase [Burkholderia]MDN7742008.1 bifunctional 3-(3-hydroxy-phenyl)propionate/3-hydroxycinnamic acid hydroxylase [Burkholderia gladioli]PEH84064.1 monooxygenase [Burkholderia gladioli]TWC62155.1 single-component resorcinol 4-hydroxylase [Burkholderia sp. SJZ089]TWC95540.1 single-component resorcinol 4-hydroxylase [Burkholderia sp. SJZ115]TWC98884.1 single-component resorcinol 4-hydroxylase [Burkholderia sp